MWGLGAFTDYTEKYDDGSRCDYYSDGRWACYDDTNLLISSGTFAEDKSKPKTDYMPYLLIGGAAVLLLALTSKR